MLKSNKVFIGGLHLSTTEADLRECFAKYGTVAACEVITDDFGQPLGYGFVEMSSEAEASRAIKALNGFRFEGRVLRVEAGRSHGGGGGFEAG